MRLLAFSLSMAAAASAAAAQSGPLPSSLPVVRLDGGAAVDRPSPAQLPSTARPSVVPVTQLDHTPAGGLDGAPSVSVSISTPLPLREMLRLLFDGTSLSLVLDERVTGSFEGDLRGLTLRQALEAVLFSRGLDYDIDRTVVRVFPRQPVTRFFDVDHLNVSRGWQRTVRGSSALPPNGSAAAATSAVEAATGEDLGNGVRALLSASGRMHLDARAGVMQVTDFSDRLDQVGVYLEAVGLRTSRQVRIDARVIEVTLTGAQPAVDWQRARGRAGADSLDGLVRAIAEQGAVRLIASPRIVAMNNEPAFMRVGADDVYFSPAPRAGDSSVATPLAISQGLTLTVTAQISASGMVRMNVAPSYAQPSGVVRSSRHLSAPVLNVADADSNVRVQDGGTVVIAGMLQDRESKVTGTGFSGFFGAETKTTVRSELVILLTPTIVAPGVAGR